ncbi:MAG: flagellar FliJ family protein [Porcipelethomonas sp.]
MKKFVFSMQKMRDYKKQILESEKNVLMSYRRERNDCESKIAELNSTMERLRRDSQKDISEGTTASNLMFYSIQMDGVKRELTQMKYQLNLIDMKIEKQRRVVVGMSQEVSGLDKLEAEQREEYNHLLAKENETAIEEFLSFKLTSQND